MLLLLEYASIRTLTAKFFHVDFRIGLQIISRARSVTADMTSATWQLHQE